jgi:hypothetical protein
MTSIYCTSALDKFLGGPFQITAEDTTHSTLSSWLAHSKAFRGKKCLFVIHIPTYYMVVMADVKKRELLQLPHHFAQVLHSRLKNDGVLPSLTSTKLELLLRAIQFQSSNNDKKAIATLNRRILDFKVLMDWHELTFTERDILLVNKLINQSLTKSRSGNRRDYINPIQAMTRTLEELL